MKIRYHLLFLLLIFTLVFNLALSPSDLDSLVGRSMTTFEVPGLSLAIVKDGKVVVAKGYGVRKIGSTDLVDAQTLFGIASNTKVFTAVALGLLVDEKKIEWDSPVIRYLPSFAMHDAWVTRQLTVRDLLVHRSGLGLGAGDLLWWPPSTYNRKEIVHRIRFIPPATSFRSAYAYDNVLYSVAGEVIEAVSGKTWEEFVTERIIRKVGMINSTVTHSSAGLGENAATTHARVDGVVRPIQPFLSDITNPAGGINSNAEDMAKWMIVLLSEGKLSDESRLYTEQTAQELVKFVTPIAISDPEPELAALKPNFSGYALGLGLRDYRGHKIITHSGLLPGYASRVLLVPDLSLGIAVLTNQESSVAYQSIIYSILDDYLKAPPTDWVDTYKKIADREAQKNKEKTGTQTAERNEASRPSCLWTNTQGPTLMNGTVKLLSLLKQKKCRSNSCRPLL